MTTRPATKTKQTKAAPKAAESSPEPGEMLRLRELVDHVTERTDGNKRRTKEVVTATLEYLGAAIEAGRALNLPGLGKLRTQKSVDRTDGLVIKTLKLRTGTATPKKQDDEP